MLKALARYFSGDRAGAILWVAFKRSFSIVLFSFSSVDARSLQQLVKSGFSLIQVPHCGDSYLTIEASHKSSFVAPNATSSTSSTSSRSIHS